MSGSRIIIAEADRLPNPHPGEFLREDFLIGSEIDPREVAEGARIDLVRLQRLLDEQENIDAELDLRLARYLGMSDGFFLALQTDYDLEEALRTKGAELERIVKRAA